MKINKFRFHGSEGLRNIEMKQDNGYVLVYVLVVFLILSAVSVSLLSVSLNNLKAQEASVQQAEARYKAEGEIERFIALAMEKKGVGDPGQPVEAKDFGAIDRYSAEVRAIAGEEYAITIESIQKGEDASEAYPYDFTVTVSGEGVCIEAALRFALTVEHCTEYADAEPDPILIAEWYEVRGASFISYQSYDISYYQIEDVA